MINEKNKWLVYGILGIIGFGLFGFFNKLSTFTNSFVANLVIQVTSLATAVVVFAVLRKSKFKFSKYSFLAGVCACIGTLFLLFALEANQLIIVYPFASMAGLVFFAILHLQHKYNYTKKQLGTILVGSGLIVLGLAFAAIGASGGFSGFTGLNLKFLLFGLGVMFFWGLLSYFWFKSRVVQKDETLSSLLSTMIGVSLTAVIGVLLFNSAQLFSLTISTQYIYPIFSGIAGAFGAYFILLAYGSITPKEPVKGLILAILTNGELIPVTILALLILGEYSFEGLIGVAASLTGIVLLNYTEYLK